MFGRASRPTGGRAAGRAVQTLCRLCRLPRSALRTGRYCGAGLVVPPCQPGLHRTAPVAVACCAAALMTAGAAAGPAVGLPNQSVSPAVTGGHTAQHGAQLPAITRTHHRRKKLRGRADDVKLGVDCTVPGRLGRASAAVLHNTLTLRCSATPLHHCSCSLTLQSSAATMDKNWGAFGKNGAWTDILCTD